MMSLNVQSRVFLDNHNVIAVYGSYLEILLHSSGVAYTSEKIGEDIGLSATERYSLRELSLYHDIGKTKIPKSILNKQEKLTHIEWQTMKKHAIYSQKIYLNSKKQSNENINSSLILRHHHENWDGSGYPDGISGKNIPVLSRIIRIADVFDAITRPRVYRTFKMKNAMDVMEKMAGREFDPYLFEKSSCTLKKLLEFKIEENAKNWDIEKT
ncbi:MAG TPA: HD domain-containing phosphohydrolase [Clostridia bacterium]|nr:HD domain-containing phosphohydrolase [Clostridia bacterium]